MFPSKRIEVSDGTLSKSHWYDDRMSDDSVDADPANQHDAKFEPSERIARRKLSHEVRERLLARIRSGEFEVGFWLPSERDFMQSFGVGRSAPGPGADGCDHHRPRRRCASIALVSREGDYGNL